MKARTYGQTVAAVAHAGIILILSIAVVRVPTMEVFTEIPEPQQIQIGRQQVAPPAMDEVIPETESPPPVGVDIPEATEPNDLRPSDDPSMIPPVNEDRPKPLDVIEEVSKGLPGEPSRQSDSANPVNKLHGPKTPGLPEMMGKPIDGDTLFLVDLSGSMDDKYGSRTRYGAVVSELANAINGLRDIDTFDVLAFSGSYSSGIKPLWGALCSATKERKREAIDWLNSLTPDGGTPTLQALQHFSANYPDSTDHLILVTDGVPDNGTAGVILDNIEQMLSGFPNLDLICISVSNQGLDFVKLLVDRVGGTYVLVK